MGLITAGRNLSRSYRVGSGCRASWNQVWGGPATGALLREAQEGRVQDADRGGKPTESSSPDAAATWPALCGIAVMAKASAAGRTKTRLVPPLNYEEAAALNPPFLTDIAQNILA